MVTPEGIILTPRQQAFALAASIALLVLIVELLRRRKLREEYTWLWLLTGLTIFVLAVWYDLLVAITRLIGATVPVSTLFMFGILFLVLANIYFSIKVSTLTLQVKNLSQRLAIVDSYVRELRGIQPAAAAISGQPEAAASSSDGEDRPTDPAPAGGAFRDPPAESRVPAGGAPGNPLAGSCRSTSL